MTESEAKQWIQQRFDVSRETWDRLENYVALLLAESERQNLIAASTKEQIWARHIVDSAQLLLHAPNLPLRWADLGAGAGLPGVVIAVLSNCEVSLIEERAKRIGFLNKCVSALGLTNTNVIGAKVEKAALTGLSFDIISARAFAPLPRLFESAHRLSHDGTRWILPKGRNVQLELEEAQALWQGVFHVEQSVVESDSAIVIVHNLKKKPLQRRRKREGQGR